ncbi:cbb3-type cytochrome oxidase assembly protein CcoS [Pseudooceanicola sp. HF7]|uniref:cbb3-type cytochrome oxidase assembly protein CcoS n=1 Tax=Pseudooceanicola sp. HF7 TaxID=2721560 RepID=UPI0014314D1A|nr:cbb3-type cytochrome oxidase assembly protein CcoS [Pseudooceanicola sp. HF7]NIZ11603.1 cbb3-type cytochrome oxidase assembly protein CcoS [Pseudooceanicola sp. HF7]
MEVIIWLIPISLFLGGLGLIAFIWSVRTNQYDDPQGNSQRILSDQWDEHPKP